MTSQDDDEYEVPLRDQRFFGAGVKRKRIHFVPSTAGSQSTSFSGNKEGSSVAEKYLSIVLKAGASVEEKQSASAVPADQPSSYCASDVDIEASKSSGPANEPVLASHTEVGQQAFCDSCKRSITTSVAAHENSIAHQISLAHSHPPSNVDRTRRGLAVLQGQGWDPDSRLGLGAKGEGVLHPIKAKENPKRVGLGAQPGKVAIQEKRMQLDAGKMQSKDKQDKAKASRLRDMFYRSSELEKYLGEDGA